MKIPSNNAPAGQTSPEKILGNSTIVLIELWGVSPSCATFLLNYRLHYPFRTPLYWVVNSVSLCGLRRGGHVAPWPVEER